MKKTAFITIATMFILTACDGGGNHGDYPPGGDGQDDATIVDVVSDEADDTTPPTEYIPVDTVAKAQAIDADTLKEDPIVPPPPTEKRSGFGFLALVIAFVLGAAASFVFCMKKNRDTIDAIYKENKKKENQLQVVEENKRLSIEEKLNGKIVSLNDQIADLKKQLHKANEMAAAKTSFPSSGYGPGYQGFGVPSQQQATAQTPAQAPVTKYGNITIEGDRLIIENVFLSDSPDGMPFRFDFAPDMSMGTYTFTDSGRQQFSGDLDFVRPYVSAFDETSGQISVVSPGRFVKSEWVWVVTEKITIKVN